MLVFGTRPEAIKMAPVYQALIRRSDVFETICCVTGQHREMLDQVLRSFGIVPDIDLDLMRDRQHPADVAAAVMAGLGEVLRKHAPDLLLVHGDTTTSMASTLAAFYEKVRVGHVEAGLRSGDLAAPFPEELNRRVADLAAVFHFAPTEQAKLNLLREGCDPGSVIVTGNTIVDALEATLKRIDNDCSLQAGVNGALAAALGPGWNDRRYVVVTCHRRESYAGGLDDICAALRRLARAFPDVRFIYPVHANPAVREPVERLLRGHANIRLIQPLPYEPFLQLLRHCHTILTDSGGLQEEGPTLGKPVLVMRTVTERPEGIAAGGVRLVGVDEEGIYNGMSQLLDDRHLQETMANALNPYGAGDAAERIADFLAARL